VAGVAVDATAPDVGRITLVIVVYPGPGVASAIGARRNGIGSGRARGIHMASKADASCTAVIDTPPGVRKRRPQPTARRVAGGAGGCGIDDSRHGRVDGHVIWHRPAQIGGALPVSGVATITIDRRSSGTDVAGSAGRGHRGNMHSRQGEPGGAVVKRRPQPGDRRMACRACDWIAGSDMVRH
jgi:hypothetical protein